MNLRSWFALAAIAAIVAAIGFHIAGSDPSAETTGNVAFALLFASALVPGRSAAMSRKRRI
jgi:NhaP-type Na+/H+ and K+/H+ antiporter